MPLRPIVQTCRGGKCPTVYRDDHGDVFVQGFDVSSDHVALLSKGEGLVKIDHALWEALSTHFKK